MLELVYVLPVHNEETILGANVARVVEYLERFDATHVYLVENGSRDASWSVARGLERGGPVTVRAFHEPSAGIGYAYDRGLNEAIAAFGPSTGHWAVLTAADLPFGFTDLEAALPHLDAGTARILIGSKAHPASVVDRTPERRVMSAVYRGARRAIVGMRVGDSQGSVFLRLDLAASLVTRIRARGFFYTTELCHYAERAGETIVELPVVLEEAKRASTVKPLKHGLEMARQLWALRGRG